MQHIHVHTQCGEGGRRTELRGTKGIVVGGHSNIVHGERHQATQRNSGSAVSSGCVGADTSGIITVLHSVRVDHAPRDKPGKHN